VAHPDYAIQAFELNAIDYLLKPIPFQRFVLAVNRFLISARQATSLLCRSR